MWTYMIQQFHIFLHISAKCNIYKIYVRTLFYIYENYVTHVTIYVHILHIYVHICCIYVRSVWGGYAQWAEPIQPAPKVK